MKATRRTQPYRKKTARQPGSTLYAMLRGAPANAPNPQDVKRKLLRRRKRLAAQAVRRSRHNRR